MSKTALVTGDAGFVGRHIVEYLQFHDWTVYGCDIKRGADCRTLFANETDEQYDLVVHCAAVVGGRMTISNDPLAVAVDLAIDSDFFRWAVRTRQHRLVYFSSCAAYPCELQVPGHPTPETDITLWPRIGTPDLTYGWTKLTGEMLAQYAEEAGVPVHIFRPFSGYGSDQDDSYPFPAYIDRALRADNPFEVWGDGEQVRDFIHIDDVVDTVFAAIEQDYRLPLNIGSGRATSFNELAELVTSAAGYAPEIKHCFDRPVGPAWRVADTTNQFEVYRPRVSLEEGIRRALTDRM